ncbi:MAG: PKD domain-containing protein [Prevotellaceae bacterium]|jgi:hypothetical protein|nr:PKD domain-containing protein [Prevotellaceae bacterium]
MNFLKLNNNIKEYFFVLFLFSSVITAFSQQMLNEDFGEFTPTSQINAEKEVILHGKQWKFAYVDCKYSNASLKECVVLRHNGSGSNIKLGYMITPEMNAPQTFTFGARLQYSNTRDNRVEVQISENGGPWFSVDTILIAASQDRLREPYRQYTANIHSTSNNVKIKILRMPSLVGTEHSDINIIIDNMGIALGDPNKCKMDCALPTLKDMCNDNDAVTLDASVSATGDVSYKWSTGESKSAIEVTKPGVYSVVITNSCGESITRQVLVRSLQDAGLYDKNGNLNQSENVCYGSTIRLNAGEGISYNWSPEDYLSNPYIATPEANPPYSTTYDVAIQTAGGCLVHKKISVNVSSPFDLNTGENNPLACKGDTVNFEVSGADSYYWYPQDGLSCYDCPNPKHTVVGNKSYTVTGEKNGCTVQETIDINTYPDAIDFTYVKNTNCEVSFTVSSVGDFSNYTWTFGDGDSTVSSNGNISHRYPRNGSYKVTLEATVNNCEQKVFSEAVITISPDECSCSPSCD